MANNDMKNIITDLLESTNLFYSLWNEPTRKPHKVCISDDASMAGNACGKLVIGGKTWREVFEILHAIKLTPDMIAGNKLHETPDNYDGKLVVITDIQYDLDEDLGDAEKYDVPSTIITSIPQNIKTISEAEDYLSDLISDVTSWCHSGFNTRPEITSLFRRE